MSEDSDEVDHSTWGIRSVRTGHTDVVSGTVVRKLRLKMEVLIQGYQNWWRRIGFQIVANGTLHDVGAFIGSINETEEIPSFGSRERHYPPMEG